jgi:hypothetical protein
LYTFLVVVVVLKHSEHLRDSGVGNKGHPNPVVDEASGNGNGVAVFSGVESLDVDPALTEFCVCFLFGRIGKAIDDQEVTCAQIVGVLGLRGANITVKSSRSIPPSTPPLGQKS